MAEVDTQKLANVLKENRESAEKAAQSAKEDRLREMQFRKEEIEKLKNKIIARKKNEKLQLFSNSHFSDLKNNALIEFK